MRSFESGFPCLTADIPGVSYEVVIATWTNRGGKLTAGNRRRLIATLPDRIAEVLPLHLASPRLFDRFPALIENASKVAGAKVLSCSIIQDTFPGATVHTEDALNFRDFEAAQAKRHRGWAPDPFSLSMLYKIWQADILRRNRELQQGKDFDIIIRARPDFPFHPPSLEFLKTLGDNDIYVDRVNYEERSVGDGFALGKPNVMSIYASFFLTAIEKSKSETWRYIHTDLFDFLIESGFNIRAYPMLGYRPDTLLSSSDIIAIIKDSEMDGDTAGDGKKSIWRAAKFVVDIQSGSLDLRSAIAEKYFIEKVNCYDAKSDSGLFYGMSGILLDRGYFASALLCVLISADILNYVGEDEYRLQDGDITKDYADRIFDILVRLDKVPLDLFDAAPDVLGFIISLPLSPIDEQLLAQVRPAFAGANTLNINLLNLARLVVQNPEHCIRLARHAFADGANSRWAADVIALGLAKNPQDPDLMVALAETLASDGDAAQAIALATEVLKAHKPHASFLAGKVLMTLRLYEEAEHAFRAAANLYPSNQDYQMLLSEALLKSGRTDEGLEAARLAAEKSPFPMAHCYNHLGHVFKSVGRLDESKAAFVEAYRRDPSWTDIAAQIEDVDLRLQGLRA